MVLGRGDNLSRHNFFFLSLTLGCAPCVHPCALRRGTDPGWQHDVADIQDLRSPTTIPTGKARIVNHSENNLEGFSHPAWSDHQPRTPLVVQDERLFTVFDRSEHHDS